jgi:hypothetical protein
MTIWFQPVLGGWFFEILKNRQFRFFKLFKIKEPGWFNFFKFLFRNKEPLVSILWGKKISTKESPVPGISETSKNQQFS